MMSKSDDLVEYLVKLLSTRKEHEARIFKTRNWAKYLSPDYLPQNPKYRVDEIVEISSRVYDFIRNRVTGNLIIHGCPGTGKTMAFLIAKRVVEGYLEEEGVKEYTIVYVTARGKWSALLHSICSHFEPDVPERGISLYKYYELIERAADEVYLHICIDNFDTLLQQEPKTRAKATAEQMLRLMTNTPNMSFTIITRGINLIREIADSGALGSLDTLNTIHFKPYTFEQCRDILRERVQLVFADGVFDNGAIDELASYVVREGGDIRKGLNLLRSCGGYLVENGLTRVDSDLMKQLIKKSDVDSDGQRLIDVLPLSDKLVLVATYELIKKSRSDAVCADDVFERQEYYRQVMGLKSASMGSFHVYLTRLSTAGIVKLRGRWKGVSREVFVSLDYSSGAIEYLIDNDPELEPIRRVLSDGGVSEC